MAEKIKALKGSRLIDGNGGEPVENAVIVIEGERIKEVGSESQVRVPDGAEVIDMGDCTLMPGLTECHIHLHGVNELTFKNPRVSRFLVSPQLRMLYALFAAQICFEMGFTTLRDATSISCYGESTTSDMVAVRDAIKAGIIAGPRILAGGLTVTQNSHLSYMHPANMPVQPDVVANGPDNLRALARLNLRKQCDYIKMCASGGGGTDKDNPEEINGTQEELDAIVDEAHRFGKPCACHCHNAEAERMAVKAGVDTIEHIVLTDDEAIAMIKAANKPLIPTLRHRTDQSIEKAERTGASEFTINKMKRIQPHCFENFQKFHKAGVKIAFGTDTGGERFDGLAEELEIYVNLGMTPMEAIQTATKNAAEALWLGKDSGTLDAGKFADVIAVDGNPSEDIVILQDRKKIRMVMKEGTVYVDKREGHEKYVIHDKDWGWKLFN